jgi:hypothetical protein
MTIVDQRDDGTVVRLIDAGDAPAGKKTAREATENPHRCGLDTGSAARV